MKYQWYYTTMIYGEYSKYRTLMMPHLDFIYPCTQWFLERHRWSQESSLYYWKCVTERVLEVITIGYFLCFPCVFLYSHFSCKPEGKWVKWRRNFNICVTFPFSRYCGGFLFKKKVIKVMVDERKKWICGILIHASVMVTGKKVGEYWKKIDD